MRILVCGDRNWDDEWIINTVVWGATVSGHVNPVEHLIHGAARGADSLAGEAAGWYDEIEVEVYPAQWEALGRAAGPLRNQAMLEKGKPDVVVAFHDNIAESKGTADMVRRAKKAGLPVYVVSRA